MDYRSRPTGCVPWRSPGCDLLAPRVPIAPRRRIEDHVLTARVRTAGRRRPARMLGDGACGPRISIRSEATFALRRATVRRSVQSRPPPPGRVRRERFSCGRHDRISALAACRSCALNDGCFGVSPGAFPGPRSAGRSVLADAFRGCLLVYAIGPFAAGRHRRFQPACRALVLRFGRGVRRCLFRRVCG